jgi:putative restriction endonuclease
MRYWWVSQNQTFRQEVEGGYMWSPKRNANGSHNPHYEFMREISPGDIVLSYAGAHIKAIGVARSNAYSAPKPQEFGSAGRNWSHIGWRVEVQYTRIQDGFKPSEIFEELKPLLPNRYSPLNRNGKGNQAYLFELNEPLMYKLADNIGENLPALVRAELIGEETYNEPLAEVLLWEEHLRDEIMGDTTLPETERESLVMARRGQGKFKNRVKAFEQCCRITRVDRIEHLRASHCKPWRDADHHQRLDGENGLLLTPTMDHLFDRGFISFRNDGRILVSPAADRPSLIKMGVPIDSEDSTGSFSTGQQGYMEYHRDSIFLKSNVAL